MRPTYILINKAQSSINHTDTLSCANIFSNGYLISPLLLSTRPSYSILHIPSPFGEMDWLPRGRSTNLCNPMHCHQSISRLSVQRHNILQCECPHLSETLWIGSFRSHEWRPCLMSGHETPCRHWHCHSKTSSLDPFCNICQYEQNRSNLANMSLPVVSGLNLFTYD